MQPHKASGRPELTLLPVPIGNGTPLLQGLFAAACPPAAKAARPPSRSPERRPALYVLFNTPQPPQPCAVAWKPLKCLCDAERAPPAKSLSFNPMGYLHGAAARSAGAAADS